MIGLTIKDLENGVNSFRESLCDEIDKREWESRNITAHKWQVLHRAVALRELVSWRFVDLMEQALILENLGKHVGSRILIRASIETLAILLYTISKMEKIVRTGEGFHQFSNKTVRLLLGSRDGQTSHDAINVLDVLRIVSKKYPELVTVYDELSETAHPNFDGLTRSYSQVSDRSMKFRFTSDSGRTYVGSQLRIIFLVCAILEKEYNQAWPEAFQSFENWIEKNDEKLEGKM